MVVLKRTGVCWSQTGDGLLGAGVFGDGLSSLRDGMFCQLSWQQKPDRSLDLPRSDGRPLVVVGKTAGLGGNSLKQIIDKGVHDGHGLGGDTGVGVHLLQHLVDVDGIGFLSLVLLLLFVPLHNGFGSLARFGGSFS